jgi:xanthosine utilization system XapX-like protein
MLRILAILAVTACVLASGPADAHVGPAERVVFEAPDRHAASHDTGSSQLLIAGAATELPWQLALLALAASLALVRRRSRAPIAAALVILIAVLAVEAAVHSVHHSLGGEPEACPTASVAAHLHGTTVAALALDQPIYRVGTAAVQSEPLLVSLRSLDPSQPRAPPFALA